MRIILFVFIIISSCGGPEVKRITEQEVKDKFYEFFDVLSVKNPDKNKLHDLVTDDYFIFENQKKYSMEEFIEFVESFKTIEDNWVLSDFEIDIDENSAHVSLRNVGKFLVDTDSGNVVMNFDWLESAYLVREDGELKFDFYFSDAIKESIESIN